MKIHIKDTYKYFYLDLLSVQQISYGGKTKMPFYSHKELDSFKILMSTNDIQYKLINEKNNTSIATTYLLFKTNEDYLKFKVLS